MRKVIALYLLTIILVFFSFAFNDSIEGTSCINLDQLELSILSASFPFLMVHYMPWYQSPPYSSYYGWHWTMNHYNPEKEIGGKREIASHYYPLIGPYDSRDPDLIEYHLLLMKIAGIDGVIVDWYGIKNVYDYGLIHEATKKLFEYIKKFNMKFVVCYEDSTIGNLVRNNILTSKNALEHAQEVFKWLENNWFSEEAYLKFKNRPVILVFGPQYFYSKYDWKRIFNSLNVQPYLTTLDGHLEYFADSVYPWIPMYLSGGGELKLDDVLTYLDSFYQKVKSKEFLVAAAFPRFHDIYKEAGVGQSYGFLNDNDGLTFKCTFEKALIELPDIIQIITWNDFGEGTVIEPNDVTGYRDLEYIQNWRKKIDESFYYNSDDLRLPLKIYNLRKNGDNEAQKYIDEIIKAVIDNDKAKYKELKTIILNNY